MPPQAEYIPSFSTRILTLGPGSPLLGISANICSVGMYVDTNWPSQGHRHSFSAYVFKMNWRTISWSCQKQTIAAISSTKAECIALTHATKVAIWILYFITEVF